MERMMKKNDWRDVAQFKQFGGRFTLVIGENSDAVKMTLTYGGEETTFVLAPNQWRDFVETVNAADADMTEQSFPGH